MSLRQFFNPTEAPINAKAATPVPPLGARDVDVTTAEQDTAILAGLIASVSRFASTITQGAANGRMLIRAAKEGDSEKAITVEVNVRGGTLARLITVNVAAKTILIEPAVTAGVVNGSETATALVAALNADANFINLAVASVAETDSGAGLVNVDFAPVALGPAAPKLMDGHQRKHIGEYIAHSL